MCLYPKFVGKVCWCFGHGLKNGGRPCPWKWPCRGQYGRWGGHGLLQKNRLCPKLAQTLPAIRTYDANDNLSHDGRQDLDR